ncbi:MAG TPA: hypothetical protein VFQ38_10405 [Longimicrobiales bacterium]|nr:hypothetical protein [Longimicrobiales bacterium]
MLLRKTVGPLVLLALLAACSSDDSTNPETPNFAGNFAVAGTVNGSTTSDITGTLAITNQQGNQASVAFTVNLRTNGQVTQTFATPSPVTATLSSDGTISWQFTTTAQGVSVTLQNQGKLQGDVITGTWSATSLAGSFSGTFTATR